MTWIRHNGPFSDLAATGWTVTEAEIERDAARLLGGTFWEFVER